MEFRKKLKTRLYRSILCVVIGVLLILINVFISDEMISTLGMVFLVMGIVRIVQYKRMMKDDESIHRQEIIENDERNISLWTNARSLAYSVYLILSAVSIMVLYFLKMDYIAQVVGIMMLALVFIYLICYIILNKKY